MGQIAATQVLRKMGLLPILMPWSHPYDVLCNGVRVEIKTGRPQQGKKNCWAVNIHRHGVLKEQCDFYVFRLESSGKPIHLVVPAPVRRLTIVFSEAGLRKLWALHINNFKAIQEHRRWGQYHRDARLATNEKANIRTVAAVLARKGGRARSKALSPERRAAIAIKAANTRWGNTTKISKI